MGEGIAPRTGENGSRKDTPALTAVLITERDLPAMQDARARFEARAVLLYEKCRACLERLAGRFRGKAGL